MRAASLVEGRTPTDLERPIQNICGKLAAMAARDGDGWVECRCGSRHWGLNGAAGLLLFDREKILLQHRAPWVHNGNTWGIPGGARDSHESPIEAALRESSEEIGINPEMVSPLSTHIDDHLDWSYVTILASLVAGIGQEQLLFEKNHETLDLRWCPINQVASLDLHPSFARSWPKLSALLLDIADEDDVENP